MRPPPNGLVPSPGAQKFNADHDIYFAVNPLKVPLSRKANKADVSAAQYLWVDSDPDGGDPAQWRASKLAELQRSPPPGIPGPPTLIIDSGRGFWCFWKLRAPAPVDSFINGYDKNKKPIIIDGPLTLEIQAHGRGLEKAYGKDADTVRNIDRIARLPGTINHRTGERAKVIEWNQARVYDLASFPRIEESINRRQRADIDFPENFDVDALGLPISIIKAIKQEFPKEKRSEPHWVFYAISCAMARHPKSF